MIARTIPAPDRWAMLDASAHRWNYGPDCTRVEVVPYIGSNGDASVLLEIMTPDGYASVPLPLDAARLVARAVAMAADEARDDWNEHRRQYVERFGL